MYKSAIKLFLLSAFFLITPLSAMNNQEKCYRLGAILLILKKNKKITELTQLSFAKNKKRLEFYNYLKKKETAKWLENTNFDNNYETKIKKSATQFTQALTQFLKLQKLKSAVINKKKKKILSQSFKSRDNTPCFFEPISFNKEDDTFNFDSNSSDSDTTTETIVKNKKTKPIKTRDNRSCSAPIVKHKNSKPILIPTTPKIYSSIGCFSKQCKNPVPLIGPLDDIKEALEITYEQIKFVIKNKFKNLKKYNALEEAFKKHSTEIINIGTKEKSVKKTLEQIIKTYKSQSNNLTQQEKTTLGSNIVKENNQLPKKHQLSSEALNKLYNQRIQEEKLKKQYQQENEFSKLISQFKLIEKLRLIAEGIKI